MRGRILIVDSQATNRIVLKVKLTAAYYKVFQASGAREALTMTARVRPDLLLVGANLPDMKMSELIARLSRAAPLPPPVVAMLPADALEARIAALQAGAADVVSRPFEEACLLARLRAIMRERHTDADLALHGDTARALGFAEDPAGFACRQKVVVLGTRAHEAQAVRERLAATWAQEITALGQDEPRAFSSLRRGPDVIVVLVSPDRPERGLSALAELCASPRTRHSRLVALLDAQVAHLVVPALDIGAHQALVAPVDDRELMLHLSRQLAEKRRGDALRRRLENGLQAAVIDPLTGLYNRRYAVSFLDRMISEAAKRGQTVAVMVADLDHFKEVNDTHGHAAGDRALARISAEMRAALPAGNMIARLGGEEFLIVVPDTSLAEARHLADRLRRLVRETAIPLPDTARPLRVTISIGVTLASPCEGGREDDAEALIVQADKALYDSKSGGRDTVSFRMRSAA